MIRGENEGQLRLLTDQQLKKVHQFTLKILEQIGISTSSDKIIEIFSGIGACVDIKRHRIKVGPELIEEALKKAPNRVVLFGRDKERDILLEGTKVHFGFGGTPPPYFRDVETGKIRRSTKKDVAEATILADALPNVSFVMSIAGAYDVPLEVEYLHELEALFNNTTKPIIYVAPGARYARKVLEMAYVVASESRNRQKSLPFALFSESTSPLRFSKINENIIECAKKGVPIVFGAGPMLGVTGPVTITGSFAIANAETLFALVLSQAVREGTPFIYAPHITTWDMKTSQVCYSAPESAIARSILTQLAKYYQLPSFASTGFGVDSKCPDVQAGVEAATNALMCALAGANLIQNVGTMAHGSYGSMEMAVICDEIIEIINRILRGVEVSENTIPMSVIEEIGPGGNFLSHEHTLKFFRNELYMPKLFDRFPYIKWVEMGSKSARTRVKEQIRDILAKHRVRPLSHDTQQQLSKIVKKAEKEFRKN